MAPKHYPNQCIYIYIFGTYSFYIPTKANQKCVYCQVQGAPIPQNYRVIRADGDFMVATTLYYAYHKICLTI